MNYTIFIEKAAQKELSKITSQDQNRIISVIRNLSSNPRPPGVKKLSGRTGWRIRVGNYRILYDIKDDKLIMYTDGLVEAMNSDEVEFEMTGLKKAIRENLNLSSLQLKDEIRRRISAHTKDMPLTDDYTLLITKRIK